MTVVPARTPAEYGWEGEGKTPAEIQSDIAQTRYRLQADLRALKAKPQQVIRRVKEKWPIAAAAGVALITLLIRRIRRKHR